MRVVERDSSARDASGCFMRPSASTLAQRTSGEGSLKTVRDVGDAPGRQLAQRCDRCLAPTRLRGQRDQRARGVRSLPILTARDSREA